MNTSNKNNSLDLEEIKDFPQQTTFNEDDMSADDKEER